MREPVLVVHGIATREENNFINEISQFNKSVGKQWNFIPVFWGNQGAQSDYMANIMPNIGSMGLSEPDDIETFFKFIQKGFEEVAEKFYQIPRMMIFEMLLPFIGDIILYQGMRQSIHEAIWNYVPDGFGTRKRPIHVIAHSLGGVIAFDMAVAQKKPLWIKHFITLGSQPSFFHVYSKRSKKISEYRGVSVKLPTSIRSWSNIWDRNDWLAFSACGMFTLHDGTHPTEHPVQQFESIFNGPIKSHTDYWFFSEVINKVRDILLSETPKLMKL